MRGTKLRLQAAFDAASVGMAVIDRRGRPLESNRAFQRLFGYSAEELRALPFSLFTAGEDVADERALARELFAGQRDAYQLEKRFVRKDGSPVWCRVSVSPIKEGEREEELPAALALVEDIGEQVLLRERRDALLRVARLVTAEARPEPVTRVLLDEAMALTGSDFGLVGRWDERQQLLVPVSSNLRGPLPPMRLGEGAGGRAGALRRPIVVNDYPRAPGALPQALEAGVRSAVAVPLLHEGRLLGVLTMLRGPAARAGEPGPEEVKLLELLASIGAATLEGVERSRLEGVLLAARTAQHELNNQLAVLLGYCELASASPLLDPELRLILEQAGDGARRALDTLSLLQRVIRLEEIDQGGPVGPVIDLGRSTRAG